MKLKIAGGCGEHGRNCFYVELDDYSFLVDCGIMADDKKNPYPNLTKEEILKLRYVFLTHSHLDHTGALPWLLSQGFKGKVISSKETLLQLSFDIENTMSLEEISKNLDGLNIKYGRSGHCLGSVWYLFEYRGKRILFSGDYSENTLCYRYDEIKDIQANLAIIDCAYGHDECDYDYYCYNIINTVNKLLKKYQNILLPVPKYGRGLEMYYLLKERFPYLKYAGDNHFILQFLSITDKLSWYKNNIIGNHNMPELYTQESHANIVFVSNPQLRTLESEEIAKKVLKNGIGIMSGTVEKNTMSYKLLQEKKMVMCRYPVHLNYNQYKSVIVKNHFEKVIPYHSADVFYRQKEYIL